MMTLAQARRYVGKTLENGYAVWTILGTPGAAVGR